MTAPTLEFWFDFASPYAYLSSQRLSGVQGVEVRYRPMLLGPVFQLLHGTMEPPALRNPARWAWMQQDLPRQAKKYGVPFGLPSNFPRGSLLGTRVAMLGEDEPWVGAFVRGLFRASFGDDADISTEAAVHAVLAPLTPRASQLLALSGAPETKERLKARAQVAVERGIFGAPTFFADGALYWGDDRLDDALSSLAAR